MRRAEDLARHTTIYRVVVNDEEQYSILSDYTPAVSGWRDTGKSGTKEECLEYINSVWIDMTPISLRKHMEVAKTTPCAIPVRPVGHFQEKSVVERLSTGEHQVEVGLRPYKTVQMFKKAIDRGYVHLKFTQTRGGTEVGMRLDRTASNCDCADFSTSTGIAHVEGSLTLDYVKVRCVADIDLSTLEGRGRLIMLG